MKKFLKWTFIILIAVSAIAAGMFCLAQYLDSKELPCDCKCDCKTDKPVKKALTRHYTKLNLS